MHTSVGLTIMALTLQYTYKYIEYYIITLVFNIRIHKYKWREQKYMQLLHTYISTYVIHTYMQSKIFND